MKEFLFDLTAMLAILLLYVVLPGVILGLIFLVLRNGFFLTAFN